MDFVSGYHFSWKQPAKLRKAVFDGLDIAILVSVIVMNDRVLPGGMSMISTCNFSKGPKVLILDEVDGQQQQQAYAIGSQDMISRILWPVLLYHCKRIYEKPA